MKSAREYVVLGPQKVIYVRDLLLVFLRCSVGAGVDVLAVSCIIHQRQMVVRGEGEMRNASH